MTDSNPTSHLVLIDNGVTVTRTAFPKMLDAMEDMFAQMRELLNDPDIGHGNFLSAVDELRECGVIVSCIPIFSKEQEAQWEIR